MSLPHKLALTAMFGISALACRGQDKVAAKVEAAKPMTSRVINGFKVETLAGPIQRGPSETSLLAGAFYANSAEKTLYLYDKNKPDSLEQTLQDSLLRETTRQIMHNLADSAVCIAGFFSVRDVDSNRRVIVGSGCGVPQRNKALADSLKARFDLYKNEKEGFFIQPHFSNHNPIQIHHSLSNKPVDVNQGLAPQRRKTMTKTP